MTQAFRRTYSFSECASFRAWRKYPAAIANSTHIKLWAAPSSQMSRQVGAASGRLLKWGRLPVPWSPGPGPMSSAMRADVALAVIFAPMCGTMCGIH
jgi:hypothetical protein